MQPRTLRSACHCRLREVNSSSRADPSSALGALEWDRCTSEDGRARAEGSARGGVGKRPAAISLTGGWRDEFDWNDWSELSWLRSPSSRKVSPWANRPAGTMGGSGARTGLPARCSALPWTVPTSASPPSSPARLVPVLLRLDCLRRAARDRSRGLERLGPDGRLVPHADLSQLSEYGWNEVTVHPSGAAYVNGINFDMMGADGMNFELGSKRGLIAVVTPDGSTRIVADTIAFPNGMAITPDGPTFSSPNRFASGGRLHVAEVHSLTGRRCGQRSTAAPTASASTPTMRCGVPRRRSPPAGAGLPDSPTDPADVRPSPLHWRTKRNDVVHGREQMERPREHRQAPAPVVYMTEVQVPAANRRNPVLTVRTRNRTTPT